MPDGAVFVVLKVLKGLCWRGRYRGEDGKDKIVEDKKHMRRIVFAAGASIFAEKNVFVSVHDFDAPVSAVEFEKIERRSLDLRQAGDEIGDFDRWRRPYLLLFALNNATNAADLPDRRPISLNIRGFNGKNVDGSSLDPAVRFLRSAVVTLEGGKPAV